MPANAAVSSDPGRTYVEARAAALNGDHARSAQLLATLAANQNGQADIARKALAEAIGAGQFDLALSLAPKVPVAQLPIEARLLLVAAELRRKRIDRARPWLVKSGDGADLSFLAPLLDAWDFADRGDLDKALATIDQIPANSLLNPLRFEQRAFILLKFRRTADAEPFARRAIGVAGAREDHLRLALADAFLSAGDRDRALMMIEGMGVNAPAQRQRVLAGRQSGQVIATASDALSEVLTAFAGDLVRLQRSSPPVALVQVARFANPRNSSATVLLALLLDNQHRTTEAMALLRTVPRDDAMIAAVRDSQVKILNDDKRFSEAFQIAYPAATAREATAADLSRLGEVYSAMHRYGEAADAYGRAVAMARPQVPKSDLWPLLLFQANALEEAGRWPETKAALQEALAIAPEQPLLLNFMGYAKLERGEDIDAAEAMIRKASALAPDDASITDSLGWALYKRGKLDQAIDMLQQAAQKDPDQADIQEHLGDALFSSGRRFEARFAWSAALITVDNDEVARRVKAKLAGGLSPANAAP